MKHEVKAQLTLGSSGDSGGEGPRTHVQVLANSVVASALILLHLFKSPRAVNGDCWAYGSDPIVVGIVRYVKPLARMTCLVHLMRSSNYAAVAADTFSSELGILSKSKPRLLTSWNLREVPPGTNGGISLVGTLAGFLGAFIIALTSVILLPFCDVQEIVGRGSMSSFLPGSNSDSGWGWQEKAVWMLAITAWGGLGSVLDSALGGWFQASVVDARTGKVIEGSGGKKVSISYLIRSIVIDSA